MDSEKRITGGKRKSSSRRSSILKGTKSPGALEDIDPNSLDDKSRSRSKKSRQSSGRRVSFAKTDDVKEFFVEDWKSVWEKDDNLQMPSNGSQGDSEYRTPADSIKGLESLLKGNIRADDNDLDRVEVQEMPEVQFSRLSTGDEDSAVCYDRGILLQTITQAQVQHTVPLDVTLCHGLGIISAPNNDPDTSRVNPSEEIEYTKGRGSGLSSDFDQTRLFSGDTGTDLDITCSQQELAESLEQSGKMDSKAFLLKLGTKPSTTQTHQVTHEANPSDEIEYTKGHASGLSNNLDQTRLFSGDTGTDLDITCSQQEVIFHDYPVQLSSHGSLEQSGKMDSKAFLLKLGAKPSTTQTYEVTHEANPSEEIEYTKCRSSVLPSNLDQTRLYSGDTGTESLEQSGKMDSKAFLLSLRSKPSSAQTHEANPSDEIENKKCRSSVLPNDLDQTRLFSGDTGTDLDITCSQQEVIFHDYPVQLSSHGSLEQSGKMDSKAFLLSLGAKPSSAQTHEVMQHTKDNMTLTSNSNPYCKRRPLGEITDMQRTMKTRQEVGGQQSNVDENVELTACHSYKDLETAVPKTKRRSIYEPVDIDVTFCYGPGLLRSIEKQEFHSSDEVTSRVSGVSLNLSVKRNSVETDLQPQASPEQTAPLDVTGCHGIGILPGKRISDPGSDQTVVNNTDNSESLDLIVCQAQEEHDSDENLELTACHSYEVLDNSLPKTHQKNICEPADLKVTSCYGPGLITGCLLSQNHQNDQSLVRNESSKMNSSAFLKSLTGSKKHSSATDSEEYDDEMDLTISGNTVALTEDKREQKKPEEPKLSMRSNFLCAKTKEAVTDLSTSIGLRNAYLIKNPFIKNTEEQEQTSKFPENLELTVCHSQMVLDSDTQRSKQRTLYEAADLEETSCYGAGLIQSPEKEETCSDVFKSALNLPRSLRAARNTNKLKGNAVFNKAQDLPGWNKTRQQESDFSENLDLTTCHGQPFMGSNSLKADRRSLFEPADIDVTRCHGVGLVESSGDKLEFSVRGKQGLDKSLQEANRRSFYEPAYIDVTSCHGAGLVESSGDNLELRVRGQPGLDKKLQQENRKSFYEPADIDVTCCHGAGLVESSGNNLELRVRGQSGLNKSLQQANRRSFCENADIDVTRCHGAGLVESSGDNLELTVGGQSGLDKSLQQGNQRSFHRPADIDVTRCHGEGLVESSGDNLELTIGGQSGLDKSLQQGNQRSFHRPAEIDVTRCHGAGLVESLGDNLELTVGGQSGLDKSLQQGNQRSFHRLADIDVTRCHGAGLVESLGDNLELTVGGQSGLDKSLQQGNQRSFHRPADSDVTSCHDPGLVKSNLGSLQLTTSANERLLDVNTESATRQSFYEHADLAIKSCSETGAVKTPDEPVINDDLGKIRLNLAERTEASFHSVSANASLDKTGLNQSVDDQVTQNVDRQLSIICEESVSELSKKELREDGNIPQQEQIQNTTQSPITLKKFLDLTELAFITEVNMRRSIAPSNVVEAPQTPKDRIISTLVSKAKATCYEEAIPALESEITVMKEKVEQQEMELNVSNPRVFTEAQSASKKELSAMQGKVRRLRSMCEKTSKREWKEKKGQLNKIILLKMKENRQALASDVHTVEESLVMVDDCLNLLDKMDKDLDEEIKGFQLSLEESEKKLKEQADMEKMTEALRKRDQELADLESTRSTLQSEKQDLANRKEELDAALLKNQEDIRLLKEKDPGSEKAANERKLNTLESLQLWSLEEWNDECAKFTFLKSTLEMVVSFGSEIADSNDSFKNREVKSIQLNFISEDGFNGKMGKVHALVKQAVNQDILSQMCFSRKDLTKVLEHMSETVLKSNEIGDELIRIHLSHLMFFKENRFVVEFASLKAFMKFVLYIELELHSYPDSLTFTVSPNIGSLSQTEIEEALNAVDVGPRYLIRLVQAADELLSKNIPS